MNGWIAHNLGIAILMFLETVFPPIPSELIMPLAGMQTNHGSLSLSGAIASGSAGAMAGNILWFAAARSIDLERFRGLIERHSRWLTLDWHDVERGQHGMRRGGRRFVCFGRMVPTVRSIVSIPAGLLRMPWPAFLIWSTIGTIGWTALLTVAGAILGQRFGAVERAVGPVATGIVILLIGIYAWRVVRWPHRREA